MSKESKELDRKWKSYGTIAMGLAVAGIYAMNYPNLETFDLLVIGIGILIAIFGIFKLVSKT